MAAKPSIQTMSLDKIFASVTGIGFTSAVKPKTEPILKILDPIKFPKEIALSFLAAAITEAASSGTLVPKAIKDTPITASLTPIAKAISFAPKTNHSLPKYKAVPPIINQINILKLETVDRVISTSSTTLLDFIPLIRYNINNKRAINKTPPSVAESILSLLKK